MNKKTILCQKCGKEEMDINSKDQYCDVCTMLEGFGSKMLCANCKTPTTYGKLVKDVRLCNDLLCIPCYEFFTGKRKENPDNLIKKVLAKTIYKIFY